jgi:hypothetical protein
MTTFLRTIALGIAIYAVMYLVWSGLVIYGLSAGYASLALRLAVLFGLTSIAAQSLHYSRWNDLLPHTIGWAVVAIVLDAIFLVPFSGWELYSSWSVWVGYMLIVLFPLIPTRKYLAARIA